MPELLKRESGEYGWELWSESFNVFKTIDDKIIKYSESNPTKITIVSERWKGNWRCSAVKQLLSPDEAVHHLITYELGYGGKIIDVSNKFIVTNTKFGDNDYTLFYGEKEKITPLLEIAAVWCKIIKTENINLLIDELFKGVINKFPTVVSTLMFQKLVGDARIKQLYRITFGEELYSILDHLKSEEIVPIKQLLEQGYSPNEVLCLVK